MTGRINRALGCRLGKFAFSIRFPGVTAALLIVFLADTASANEKDREARQHNVIFILTDDQRYDELGFMNEVIDTPNMDRIAAQGVHFRNAFVTTSLCSPSRASILTGQFMHNHGVVDNNAPPKAGTRFFPEFLQASGYETAFVGKWHMGEKASSSREMDDPQTGFDHWVSFAGQGEYYPRVRNGEVNKLNINGTYVPQKGYITDELTDYALNWLGQRGSDKPFFLYLSHKAVHADFSPAERHRNLYEGSEIKMPESQASSAENRDGKPMWVQNQRNSWHGVDFPYHSDLDVQAYKMQYHRALAAVDESIGRIFAWLEKAGQLQNTYVVLMGDNGFMFGEHGLIDKRNAYEESIRVPLLMSGPGLPPGLKVDEIVANIDIAPTMLEIAGGEPSEQFDGAGFLQLARGQAHQDWPDELLYEYYWEFNYPSTPTTFALRTARYKFIQYHGIWDTDELYDLENDPRELHNLIADPQYLQVVADLRQRLFTRLRDRNGGHTVPYTEKFSSGAIFRHRDGSEAANFPLRWQRNGAEDDLREFMIPDRVRARRNNQSTTSK